LCSLICSAMNSIFPLCCILFLISFGLSEGAGILSAQLKCSGWFCSHLELNLVSMDFTSGSTTKMANFIPPTSYYSLSDLIPISTIDPTSQTFYLAVADPHNMTVLLYSYSIPHNKTSQVSIPFTISASNISTVTFNPKTLQLLVTYGPNLVSIDPSSGKVQSLFQIWKDTTLTSGFVATLDSTTQLLYTTVFSSVNTTCYYLYTVNLQGQNFTSSDCQQTTETNPFAADIIYLAPFAKGKLVSLTLEILGGEIDILDPKTMITNDVFGVTDFAGEGWTLYAETVEFVYSSSTNLLYMIVSSGDDDPTTIMVSVNVQTAEAVAGGEIDTDIYTGFQVLA